MSDSSIPVSQIAERYKVSRTTIYKVAPECHDSCRASVGRERQEVI
jgi:hypothetical protein